MRAQLPAARRVAPRLGSPVPAPLRITQDRFCHPARRLGRRRRKNAPGGRAGSARDWLLGRGRPALRLPRVTRLLGIISLLADSGARYPRGMTEPPPASWPACYVLRCQGPRAPPCAEARALRSIPSNGRSSRFFQAIINMIEHCSHKIA